jgi:hypothetical protein
MKPIRLKNKQTTNREITEMKRRIIAVLMAAVLLMAVCPTAFAENATPTPTPTQTVEPEAVTESKDVTVSVGGAIVGTGVAYIPVTVTNAGDADITLNTVSAKGNVLKDYKADATIPAGSSADVLLNPPLSTTAAGTYADLLTFKFDNGITKTANITISIEAAQTNNTDPTKNTAAFMLSSYDTNGLIVSTASGKNGGKVTVRLPLLCVDGPVSNIKATPKISTSLDEFPFAVEQIDYTLSYAGAIGTNQVIEFQFNMRFADKVTAGVKKVDFTVTYDRGWGSAEGTTTESCDISLYVNVTKGYEGADSTDGSGTTTQTLPKLVVDSYQFSTEKIEAGDTFDLTFTVRNTSSDEDVKSILVTVSNNAETGKLTPAEGSNTLYIDKLAKGESKTMTMSIATAADTEAKAYEIKLDFEYEGSKSRPESLAKGEASASIPVTVMQKIRLKIDDPTVDGEAMEGESVPVYFSIYNMGRSAIYNCIITVEGDGLSLEDSFFQGTLAAGNSLRADLSVITATPGQIDGEIVITYEDSLEEQKEERLPLSLYVTEAYTYDDTINIDDSYIDYTMDDTSSSSGMPVWGWIVIGVVVAGAAVAAIVLLKKKRAKDLEDI